MGAGNFPLFDSRGRVRENFSAEELEQFSPEQRAAFDTLAEANKRVVRIETEFDATRKRKVELEATLTASRAAYARANPAPTQKELLMAARAANGY